MSIENIKTGLRLSEAIKLLEENDGALVRPETEYDKIHSFDIVEKWVFSTKCLWSVKLPPPKTVTVTRDDVVKAFYESYEEHKLENGHILNDWNIEKFLKELGL